jgi:IPT/TIG domain-containing protein
MNAVRACLTFLCLALTIGCSSAMPGHSNNSGSMVISSFSPGSVSPGAQDFTLTIVGSGFPALSSTSNDQLSVLWGVGTQNEVYLSIDFAKCDANHIVATVPAALVQSAGTFDVQVQIFHLADDTPKAVSNIVHFVVSGAGPWDY